jgi:hypothetical protein
MVAERLIDGATADLQGWSTTCSPTEVDAMNAEARVLAEPAEGSAGARHVARRLLAATGFGFAMLVVLGGTSRADPLEPLEGASETVSDAVSPVVETVTGTVSPVVETLNDVVAPVVETVNDTVSPVVETVNDTVEPIVDILGPVRESTEVVLPKTRGGGVGLDPRSPPPRSPVDRDTPPNIGAPPVSIRDPLARRTMPIAPAGMPSIGTVPLAPSVVLAGTDPDSVRPPGMADGWGGDRWPSAPFGRGVADAPLVLLVLFVALAGSLAIRPPPLTISLVPRIAAPNGAALALSVERPG